MYTGAEEEPVEVVTEANVFKSSSIKRFNAPTTSTSAGSSTTTNENRLSSTNENRLALLAASSAASVQPLSANSEVILALTNENKTERQFISRPRANTYSFLCIQIFSIFKPFSTTTITFKNNYFAMQA